jgi:hypothetical protein
MRIATGEETDLLPIDDGKDPGSEGAWEEGGRRAG